MKAIILIYIIIVLLFSYIFANNIQIHPLNNLGDNIILEINKNESYYFFTPINDVKINEPISYFISKEIIKFEIGYIFLPSDRYEDISQENIDKYEFNNTLEFLDHGNYFKTMFKSNYSQNGLLFSFNIIDYEKNKTEFNITRINMTIINVNNETILIKNNFNYFYLNMDINSYFKPYTEMLYDLLIFTSNGKKRIQTFHFDNNNKNIILNDEIDPYILFYDFYYYFFFSDYIYIQNDDNKEIYLNILLIKKNKIIETRTIYNIHPIELCKSYSEVDEIYFITKYKDFSYFYKQLFGQSEGYYIKFSEIDSLDNFFRNNVPKMHLFENTDIIYDDYFLFYFKCKENKPSILEFFYKEDDFDFLLKKGESSFHITKYERYNEKYGDIYISENSYNSSISFETVGCELNEKDYIRIILGNNNLFFNNTIKKYELNNINIEKGNYRIYSNKICAILVKLYDNNENKIFLLNEHENIQGNNGDIFFKYPKIKEDIHYLLEFSDNNYPFYPSCTGYYDDIDTKKFIKYNFLNMNDVLKIDFHIKNNPYRIFENNDNNYTFLIYCHTNSIDYTVNIKPLEKKEGIINKIFYAENYTEYIFPQIEQKPLILIQRFNLNSEYSIFYFSNYERKLERDEEYFWPSKGDIQKLIIQSKRYHLKISYIDSIYNEEFSDFFYINFDGKDTLTFFIDPFVKNEVIKYVIHLYNDSFDLMKKESYDYDIPEKFVENYGDITINETFYSSDTNIFEHIFKIGKIDKSYKHCIIIGTVVKTEYCRYYQQRNIYWEYIPEKKNNNLLIILLTIFGVLIIIGIVILIIWLRRRKRNNNILVTELPDNLLKDNNNFDIELK